MGLDSPITNTVWSYEWTVAYVKRGEASASGRLAAEGATKFNQMISRSN